MAPHILLTVEHPKGGVAPRNLRLLAARYLSALRLEKAELSIVLTTDRRIRRLNREWRQKDQPTDVLSFPAGEVPRAPGAPRPLGDIVISLDTARRRAREEKRLQRDELARYLAHGLLHLLGHDHHEPSAARRMARAETKLLGAAGMVAAAQDAAASCAPESTVDSTQSTAGSRRRAPGARVRSPATKARAPRRQPKLSTVDG